MPFSEVHSGYFQLINVAGSAEKATIVLNRIITRRNNRDCEVVASAICREVQSSDSKFGEGQHLHADLFSHRVRYFLPTGRRAVWAHGPMAQPGVSVVRWEWHR